jgi:cell division FtsZ-interacting protein ZapD
MATRNDINKRIAQLRLEYRKVFSMLSMMEKGTKKEDLLKMREKQLDPITNEITRLERELGLLK